MKDFILQWFQGKCCTINDIVLLAQQQGLTVVRSTVLWAVNQLIKQDQAIRIGRGSYRFVSKPQFRPVLSAAAQQACALLAKRFKYVEVTATDTGDLGQFMNLQPFATVVTLEVKKEAVDAVISALRREELDAYAKKDFPKLERYVTSNQPIVVRSELEENPTLPAEKNVRLASLEKTLVDLVCDEDIYGHYQGTELENIYQNATNRFSVNYSKMFRYAAIRKKKDEVILVLKGTTDYQIVRDYL